MDQALINEFKKNIKVLVKIFLKFIDMYSHDNDNLEKAWPAFNKFIQDFNIKYPAIEITLENEDFTKDDLKILINNYSTKEEIVTKFKFNFPTIIKNNANFNKLQFFVNYKQMNDPINYNLDLLAALATEYDVKDGKLVLPEELEKLSLELGESFSATDQGFANK
ncbi:MAG: hypothetical protein ACMXYG_01990 [Candidatus Woesearchaeota archaeon]